MRDLVLPIDDGDLRLRQLTEDDFPDHTRLFSLPSVVRYLYEDVLAGEELRAHFEKRLWRGLPAEGEWANLAVVQGDRFLGEVGFGLSDATHRTCEIGYVFLPEVGGFGLATRATRATVDLCFDVLGAHRVTARLDARNHRSAALAQRLGFRREAHYVENEFVKGEWADEVVYAVLDREWHSSQHPLPRSSKTRASAG